MLFFLPMLAYPDSELPSGVDPRPSEPDLEQLIAVLRTTPENGWVRVNNNEIQDVWTPAGLLVSIDDNTTPAPWGPRSIIDAYSGFAWDSRRGDLIIYGGGHANYPGNEVYRWRATTLVWERMSLPSDLTIGDYPWLTVDGPNVSPQSAHTYDNNIYLPIVDRFLTFGGPTFGLGEPYEIQEPGGTFRFTGPYFFDPARADDYKVGGITGSHPQWDSPYSGVIGGEMWENRDVPKNLPAALFPQHFVEGSTGYTQENGKDVVFVHAGYDILSRYTVNDIDDPTQDEWEQVGEGVGWGPAAGVYLPTHDLYVRISTNLFSYWDLSTAGPTNSNVAFVPDGEFVPTTLGDYGLGDYGMDYDQPRNRLLLWGGGGDVYALYPPPGVSPDGWMIEKLENAVTPTPDEGPGTGVLGKWKYLAQIDAFIALQDRYAGNVWIYKPENWVEPVSDDPHVTLAEPTSKGFTIPGNDIVVTAVASNQESDITEVELLVDGQTIAVLTEPPYTTTLTSVTQGVYTFEAIATDNNGNSFISPRVSATVANHVNYPPSVNMIAPLAGTIAYFEGRTISLGADASDSDGSIAQVEFFLNGSSLGVDTTAPYSLTWEVLEGSHMLSAAATDDTGITTASGAVEVNVTEEDLMVLQEGLSGYSGTTDTSLDAYHTTLPLGSMDVLDSQENLFNPLVRYAVFSNEGGPVPEGATIAFAALALYKWSEYDYSYRVHPLLLDWVEDEATWLEAADGVPWQVPGAAGMDSDYAASGSPEVYADWDPGWVVFDVTDTVQSMSLGEQSNYGWQLIAGSGNPNQKSFRASEYPVDPTLRPKLILQFDENANGRPAVAMTAPGEGANYIKGDTVILGADASDLDGTVAQVDFYYNDVWIGVDSTAPYSLTWSNVPAGTHLLTAVATDDAYAPATSAAVTINVTPLCSGCGCSN